MRIVTRVNGAPQAVLALAVAALLATSACGGGSPQKQATDLIGKGLQAQSTGNLDEAGRDYRDAIKKDPSNKIAYYDLAVVDQTKGRLTLAETEYRQALRLDPNFVPALFNLAIVRTAAGSKNEAVDLYRRAIAAQPSYAAAHLNLGFLLRDIGEVTAGNAELAKAVQIDPSLRSRIPK